MRALLVATGVLAACAAARASSPARWEPRATMGVPRQEVGVAAVGKVLYAIGGYAGSSPSSIVEAYDTEVDRWTEVASLPAALHHVMAAAVDGTVYAAGGLGSLAAGGAADSTFAYDPAADAWTSRAALPRPRGAGAAAVIEGHVYVAGGIRNGASVPDLTVYDPTVDTWRELPPMPTARDHLAAGAIGGRLYVVGGRDGATLYGVVEVFDPVTGSWSGGRQRMPTPRGGLGAAALGGLLYTFGGEGNPESPSGTFPQTEAYDPERDTWTRLPDMGVPRHGIGAAAIGGAIYVMGGATRQGLGPAGAGEVFFPATGDVLSITQLRASRPAALRLRGILVAAGDLDPGSSSFALRLDGDEGTIADLSLPARSLRAARGGRRWRLAPVARTSSVHITRLGLRRGRGANLMVRLAARVRALPVAGRTLTVALTLGSRTFTGAAAVRGGRRLP